MTFVSDNKALRTYDPERGIELKDDGGGSDGSLDFLFHRIGEPDKIVGRFSVYGETRPATDEERSTYPEAKSFCLWVVYNRGPVDGHDDEQSKAIIREAMLAYRGVHGAPVGTNVTLFDVKI